MVWTHRQYQSWTKSMLEKSEYEIVSLHVSVRNYHSNLQWHHTEYYNHPRKKLIIRPFRGGSILGPSIYRISESEHRIGIRIDRRWSSMGISKWRSWISQERHLHYKTSLWPDYCCAISCFNLDSSSTINSPDRSIVTWWIFPVKVNGEWYACETASPKS